MSKFAVDMNPTQETIPMNWEKLISSKRLGMEEYHDPKRHTRSDFQRDYDRVIFSSPFRRLQNKTQVFPLPGSIFVHNRLTHSLEVSSVGRSMANEVIGIIEQRAGTLPHPSMRHIPDIVATACLCHDIGNPPFGHSGEKTIATFFSEGEGMRFRPMLSESEWNDVTNFEGNANSFRLLTHRFVGRREGGFAMTYSSLASIVKYPYASLLAGEKGKFGFFTPEAPVYARIAAELGIPQRPDGSYMRHPLVYIMEAADDICYQIMDLEDAHRLKIVSTQEVADLFLAFFPEEERDAMRRTMSRLADPNEQVAYLRSRAIGTLVGGCAAVFADNEESILAGSFAGSLVSHLPARLREGYQGCSDTAWAKIYRAPEVVDIEIAGNRIITFLMSRFTDAVLHPEKNTSQLLLAKVPQQYDIRSETLYGRLHSVLDHISGMTDVYALDLFRKLNGHSLPAI